MAAKVKGAGGNLTRSEVVTVRFDPKLKFGAELAARKQRRTISSFIEWAVEQALQEIVLGHLGENPVKALWSMNHTWDVEEADRFANLAFHLPALLNFQEESLWKIIREHPYFWRLRKGTEDNPDWNVAKFRLIYPRVRECWDTLNQIVAGDMQIKDLPTGPLEFVVYPDDDVPF